MSNPRPRAYPDAKDPIPNSALQQSSAAVKARLREISQIPIRRTTKANEGEDEEEEGEDKEPPQDVASSILLASSLKLNLIRTRSALSPLRFSSSAGVPWILSEDAVKIDNEMNARPNSKLSHQNVVSVEQGGKVHSSESKSLRAHSQLSPGLEGSHAAFAKEMLSPRHEAILRVRSGRKKRNSDIKSFSHELNSKGVSPYPVWKHRTFGNMEEVMVVIRTKFNNLKEEVDFDLGVFAGDLVGILEKNSGSHPEWKDGLEDLLVVAQRCAKMSPSDFWMKSEAIVQSLDDRRQELPVGILKQAHTRLLFILTRCTRLVQFQREWL